MTPLRVRVAFDLACPWCFIAEKRLGLALHERSDLFPIVERLPFVLNPGITGSVPREEVLLRKFGTRAALDASEERLSRIGRDLGIPFDFAAIDRIPDTVPAHALVKWATEAGLGMDVLARLYYGYFCEGRDIGQRAVLTEIAAEAGLDADAIRKRLEAGDDHDGVRAAAAALRRAGVTGVPLVIFGSKVAIQGAQEQHVFARAIKQTAGPVEAELAAAASWN